MYSKGDSWCRRKEKIRTHTKGRNVNIQREGAHLDEKERGLRKKSVLSTPLSQTSGLQNYEQVNFFKKFVIFCYNSPNSLICGLAL